MDGIVLRCTLDRHWPPPHKAAVCTRLRLRLRLRTLTVTVHDFICWFGRDESACGILTCRYANEPR